MRSVLVSLAPAVLFGAATLALGQNPSSGNPFEVAAPAPRTENVEAPLVQGNPFYVPEAPAPPTPGKIVGKAAPASVIAPPAVIRVAPPIEQKTNQGLDLTPPAPGRAAGAVVAPAPPAFPPLAPAAIVKNPPKTDVSPAAVRVDDPFAVPSTKVAQPKGAATAAPQPNDAQPTLPASPFGTGLTETNVPGTTTKQIPPAPTVSTGITTPPGTPKQTETPRPQGVPATSDPVGKATIGGTEQRAPNFDLVTKALGGHGSETATPKAAETANTPAKSNPTGTATTQKIGTRIGSQVDPAKNASVVGETQTANKPRVQRRPEQQLISIGKADTGATAATPAASAPATGTSTKSATTTKTPATKTPTTTPRTAAVPAIADVQEPRGNVFFAPISDRNLERTSPRMMTPEQAEARELIRQREMYRAKQRVTRMQLRRWNGSSSLRPQIGHGSHAVDLNRGAHAPYWSGPSLRYRQ